MVSVVRELKCLVRRAILARVDAQFGHGRDEVRRSSRGAHMPSIRAFRIALEVSLHMRRI
jgi:hypothetical protein